MHSSVHVMPSLYVDYMHMWIFELDSPFRCRLELQNYFIIIIIIIIIEHVKINKIKSISSETKQIDYIK